MESIFYNIKHGYVEGIVRGYRNELLTQVAYSNLTQCEKLDDMRLQLTPTYGEVYNDLPAEPALTTSVLVNKATEKLVRDFTRVRVDAVGSLARFMDYITYGYMIDNVVLLITGTLHGQDTTDLLKRCHPLGWFDTMPVLTTATNIEELYNTVLIETPLADYFKGSVSVADLDELNIEIIRNTLYKHYLEDFYRFVTTEPDLAGTATSEVMAELLDFEADRRSINITANSIRQGLKKEIRQGLYPAIGQLYPTGTFMLGRADDFDAIRVAVDGVSELREMVRQAGIAESGRADDDDDEKSLETIFYEKEMQMCKNAFTRQFSHSTVYAWVKMKEQEIRNITWISECIAHRERSRINNYVSVF